MMPPGRETSATIWSRVIDKCLSALELVLSGWRAAGRIMRAARTQTSPLPLRPSCATAQKQLESLRRDALLLHGRRNLLLTAASAPRRW